MVSLNAAGSSSTSWPAARSAATSAGSKRLSSLSVVVVSPQVRPSSQRGAATACASGMPKRACRVNTAACVCGWPSPPIVPNGIVRPSSNSASDGFSVWKGLRPGSSALSARASSEKLVPRFCQVTPVPGTTQPEPNSQ